MQDDLVIPQPHGQASCLWFRSIWPRYIDSSSSSILSSRNFKFDSLSFSQTPEALGLNVGLGVEDRRLVCGWEEQGRGGDLMDE